jgi:hypothetical protein
MSSTALRATLVVAPALLGAAPFSDGGVPALPQLVATLTCDDAPRPGRVVCVATLRSSRPWRLTWADALVVRVPDFIAPLRSRVLASEDDQGAALARVAFVAERPGTGEVTIKARAVLCADAEGRQCRTAERDVTAPIKVLGGDEP